ncbi:MAG: type I restriction enzyme, S subunit [Candidatus Nitrotoga sp. LAW]|nr:MAG: type I restriction enzyme, S subunit [Candidatus Nitrotoga sp. LAW]
MKSGWQTKMLGEVIQLEYGKPLDRADRNPNGRYPAYGANGIKARTDKFYKDNASIVVGRKGSAGEITLTEEKFWPLDVTYFVEFDRQHYDLRFLYHLLTTLNLPSLAKGVKPGINRNEVYALPVHVPPLPEQQRIVDILDEAFDGIAATKANAEKNLQNTRALFESHLQSVFKKRGEGWVEKTLGEMATFRNGINFNKSSKGEPIKILGVKNFRNCYWAPLDDFDSIIPDGTLADSDTLKQNDIVFVRSNGNPELIGRCLLVGEVSERAVHSGFTIRARLHTSEISPDYLCRFLKSNKARREMIDGGNGLNTKSLNQGTLSRLVIPFPYAAEQSQIVDSLEEL